MADIRVEPVQSRRDQRQFLELPWELYRGDPNWVPPLRRYQQELLGFKPHPFHEVADVVPFLARRGERVVGRIAAIIHHGHNRR
ncbi:MAG TPA: N-acetyltransferase, partial [Bryobacterales bacterium]|nr:N-acetyltransferase [Bryobacterales bacterium]